MKFTAFPVIEGDAFFLECNNENILVDTGRDAEQCKKLLIENAIEKIDLIAITHYDIDHVGGLSSILNSDIKINEIWMPAGFKTVSDYEFTNYKFRNEDKTEIEIEKERSIISQLEDKEDELTVEVILQKKYLSKTFKKTASLPFNKLCFDDCHDCDILFHDCFYYFHKFSRHFPNHLLHEKDIYRCLKQISKIRECIDKMEFCLLSYGFLNNYYNFYPANIEFLVDNKIKLTYINRKHIDLISQICRIVEQKKIKVKWFEYSDVEVNPSYDTEYTLKCLNGICIDKPKRITNGGSSNRFNSGMDLELTQINKESLVYLFNSEEFPDVLFTADSDFSFLKTKIGLKQNSIVTAPHHGSKDYANLKVYSLLDGENIVFVRSDKSTSKRPCNEYINNKVKYCTICNTDLEHQSVVIEYNNNNWLTLNNKQLCHCIKVT